MCFLGKTPCSLQVWAAALAGCVSLTWATAAPAGTPGPQREDRVSVGYVYVPIVVGWPDGHARPLKREDFRLRIDGRPAAFETFETGATAPASVVVLQDLSGSMANGGKLAASRNAVQRLLDQARPGDEFALAWFAGGVLEVDVPFTSDLAALRDAVDSWEAYGTTALQDALAWLPQVAAGRNDVKRAAVLITDGVDNASTVHADVARQILREAELPVYVMGLGSGRPTTGDDGHGPDRFADMLARLATMTGGRYYAIRAPAELEGSCADMLEDLRHQYVLGFSVGGTGVARDHRLDVAVAGRGRRTLTYRRGYYGLDPEEPSASAERR
jgi:VWFA-related protein